MTSLPHDRVGAAELADRLHVSPLMLERPEALAVLARHRLLAEVAPDGRLLWDRADVERHGAHRGPLWLIGRQVVAAVVPAGWPPRASKP